MKTVYMTEDGVDLFDAFPDMKQMNDAIRRGENWYDMELYNPRRIAKNPPFQLVVTTKAEWAATAVAQFMTTIVGRPESERTFEALVEAAATFGLTLDKRIQSLFVHNVCETLVSHNIVYTPPPPVMTPPRPTRHASYIQALIKSAPPPKTVPNIAPLFPNVARYLDFDADDATHWYYQDTSGQPLGPFNEKTMQTLWRKRNVTKRTPVRCGQQGTFTPIGTMFGRQRPFTHTQIA